MNKDVLWMGNGYQTATLWTECELLNNGPHLSCDIKMRQLPTGTPSTLCISHTIPEEVGSSCLQKFLLSSALCLINI